MAFQAINWTPNEIISEPKMDQLARNVQTLYNRMPQAIYNANVTREKGVRIVAGRALIPANQKSDNATVAVRFGNFFTARCEPIITTGVVTNNQVRIFCVINGLGSRLHPDHTGFNIAINVAAEAKKNDKIAHAFFVSWQAMGY